MAAPAANGAAPVGADQFGFLQALKEGGVIAWLTLSVLVIMSVGSWYIFFVKLIDQNRIIKEGRRARTTFWQSPNLRDAANKLDKNGAYRQIVEDGLLAEEQHNKLTDPTDQHEWMMSSLTRSQGAITAKLSTGLAFLATVGSTAPFVGLFGTVWGILNALVAIGVAGQASLDKTAGPIGEALIMTAIGLFVAVPAVMGYNWLLGRNKVLQEALRNFTSDLHAYLVGGARVTTQEPGGARPAAAPAASIRK